MRGHVGDDEAGWADSWYLDELFVMIQGRRLTGGRTHPLNVNLTVPTKSFSGATPERSPA
jgi:hypothetical protein